MRRLLGWLGRLAYAGALLAAFTVAAYLSFGLFVRRGVTRVPDLVGLPQQRAMALLSELGLVMQTSETGRFDDAVAADLVVEQRPPSGGAVKRGAAVEVVLSLGPELVRVPDLSGQALAAAQVSLAGQGLKPGAALTVASGAAPPGSVVGQSPAPGELASREAPVDLLLAGDFAPDRYLMPDLVNLRFEPVRHEVEARGLRLGSVQYEPYEGLPPGVILRQQPPAGQPLGRRVAIALVVSGATSGGA